MSRVTRRTAPLLTNTNSNAKILKEFNNRLAPNLNLLAQAVNQIVQQNAPANLASATMNAGKKAALTLFPPPDEPKTNAERKAVNTGVPEVQLEQVDEDVETSVLLPPYIKGETRLRLIAAWKNIVSGQAFSGSYIEFYGQKWVYSDKVSKVYDCDRDIQRSYNGETFQNVFLNKNGWMQGSKKQIFLKSKFSLTDVNSIPGWKELQTQAKGANDVEPDILVCEPARTRNSKPTVFIVEMKIGLGKTDSIPEHHQLCRIKRTVEKWLDDFEKTLKNRKNNIWKGWVRPEIQLVFVGWAAPTPEKVVFKVPGKTVGRVSPVPVPYVNQSSGAINPGYEVMKTNSVGFGNISGVRAGFVTKIIEELNFKRASAFYKVFSQILNTTTNLGRQIETNRISWLNTYGAETGPALRSRVAIELLTKKKSKSAPGTIQKLSDSINKNLASFKPINNAIGRMLHNATTYNSTIVPGLITQLKNASASRNNWLSIRNYILKNNSKKTPRATAILKNMISKGVNNLIINNVFRNVYNSPVNYIRAKQLASSGPVPAAVAAGRRR